MATAMASRTFSRPITRRETEIWLIGQISDKLSATKLPSKKEVMALFFHYKETMKQTVREASHSTSHEVLEVWDKARIPTTQKIHVVDKVENVFREFEKLRKNRNNKAKRSEALKNKEEDWQNGLEQLFDISHANAMEMITIDEDRAFLLAQREAGRRGKMSGVDTVLAKNENEAYQREQTLKRRLEKETEQRLLRDEIVTLVSSSSESDDEAVVQPQGQVVDDDVKPCTSGVQLPKRARRGIRNLLDDKLAISLDMAKVSDRNAALILTPALQSLGHNPAEFNVNRSSIRRQRIQCRQNIAENLKAAFRPGVPLTIHWDGKLLEDISNKEIVDRLPVLVSGVSVDQLLGVPKLSSGTGEASAAAVYEAVIAWNISDQVKCMCFDTTSVNSGPRNGACILLEQKLDKDMLWCACRHHILEIMLEAVVILSLGPSQGPDIMIFKRFQTKWEFIDRSNYDTATSDEKLLGAVSSIASEIIAFAERQLEQFQPRDDYRELLELTITFLGGLPSRGISFKTPAGLHRARWMAKSIYSLKIWMFKRQFKLTKREEKGLADISLFTVMIYIKTWFQAPNAPSAPRIDLDLLKDLEKYKEHNAAIANIAMKKFLGHLWYLSEELVALAFFDDGVSVHTKRQMVAALHKTGIEHPQKRITLDTAVINSKQLEDFVTDNTHRFFRITGIPVDFLKLDVDSWPTDENYTTAKAIVSSIRVVNDIAERGVALMEEYNKLHTNNEEQKQYLLLVVKNYRQRYPNRNKETLMQ